jgi:hypothetical protein
MGLRRGPRRRRWFVLFCLTLVALPPATAYAATQITYAQGVNGVGGVVFATNPKFANRNYNQVWHKSGKYWTVWYQDTAGKVYCSVSNSNNPTRCGNASANKWSLAQNLDDNSFVTWTAQTTVP